MTDDDIDLNEVAQLLNLYLVTPEGVREIDGTRLDEVAGFHAHHTVTLPGSRCDVYASVDDDWSTWHKISEAGVLTINASSGETIKIYSSIGWLELQLGDGNGGPKVVEDVLDNFPGA